MIGIRLIGIAIGLVAGNYLYQMAGRAHWDVAMEHSIFEILALFCVWLSLKLAPLASDT